MATPTVQEILNMKSYELKEFLQDQHVPVPKRQSKEFLQYIALQAHADLEGETSRRRIITRRRSKREETNHSSTYANIHGRSSNKARSSPARSSPSHSTITTRSKATASIKTEAESPSMIKQEHAVKELAGRTMEPPAQSHGDDDQEEDISKSPFSSVLQTITPSTQASPPFILMNTDAWEREAALHVSSQQAHEERAYTDQGADTLKLPMAADEKHPEKGETQVNSIKQSVKARDHEAQNQQANRSSNQEVVIKKIIRVDGEAADHQRRNTIGPWIKKSLTHTVNAHPSGGVQQGGQVSRLQKLKRSGSALMSQVNDRVFKKIRKVHNRRPSSHIAIALLLCTICVAAMGATSYWYRLKKLEEEERARKRWQLW